MAFEFESGTHNYGLDNREASYKFFDSVFIWMTQEEFPNTDTEIESAEDLAVPVSKDNLTILSLAQSLAKSIHHEVPAQPGVGLHQREKLKTSGALCAGHLDARVAHQRHSRKEWRATHTLRWSNGLSATAYSSTVTALETAPTTILMADAGMPSTMVDVADDVDRGKATYPQPAVL